MVFTNPIMTIHVNRTVDQPPMNSMAAGGYRTTNAVSSKQGYRKSFVVIAPIFDRRDGHYVGLNKVAFKYFDFKKDANPNVHVRVFNSVVKANVETSKEYIIITFSYMQRNIKSDWCHNYTLKFLNYIFSELT